MLVLFSEVSENGKINCMLTEFCSYAEHQNDHNSIDLWG